MLEFHEILLIALINLVTTLLSLLIIFKKMVKIMFNKFRSKNANDIKNQHEPGVMDIVLGIAQTNAGQKLITAVAEKWIKGDEKPKS